MHTHSARKRYECSREKEEMEGNRVRSETIEMQVGRPARALY